MVGKKDRGIFWREGGRGLTARAVSVENTRDAYIDTILVVETVCKGFGYAFPLIVACAWTDGVDVAPTILRGVTSISQIQVMRW